MSGASAWLFLVGPFPPPVHGMAVVNQAIADRLRSAGRRCHITDVAARSISRHWWPRLARAPVVALLLLRFAWLLLGRRGATVYLSLSGGPGQVYDALFLAVSRLGNAHIVVHHHSYRYVRRRTWLAALVTRLAGSRALHVGQCGDHTRRLQVGYRTIRRTLVVSNAAFMPFVSAAGPRRERLRTVGFLGNVSREKGITEFLEVCHRLRAGGSDGVRAVIAGPFAERHSASAVRALVDQDSNVTYLGPVYGAAKRDFFASIDVLLFPSHEESEPLTVYEALAAGVPVIALARGCLATVLQGDAGITFERSDTYIAEAVRQIEAWLSSSDDYRRAAASAYPRYVALAQEGRRALECLIRDL